METSIPSSTELFICLYLLTLADYFKGHRALSASKLTRPSILQPAQEFNNFTYSIYALN